MMKLLLTAAAALTLTACGFFSGKSEKKTEKETALCGGYTEQRTPDAEELALFQTVTHALTGVSYTPESVATQVVAGTNYRFVCKAVTATAEPETYRAEVIVFRPLPGRGDPKITSIKRL